MDKTELLKKLNKSFDEGKISHDELINEQQKILNESGTSGFGNEENVNTPLKTNKYKLGTRKDIWYASILAVVLLSLVYLFTDGFKTLKTESIAKRTLPFVNVYFEDDEVYPVYLKYLKTTGQGLMDLTITNPDNKGKTVRINYGFPKIGELETQIIHLKSSSVQKISITPFSTNLKEVSSPVNSTLIVKVIDEQNTQLYSEQWNIKINAYDEMPWKIKNTDCTHLIASWVTPKGRLVNNLIRKNEEKTGKKIRYFRNMNDEDFTNLVKELFNTVKDENISYNTNTITFGEGSAQRIREPELTLKSKSASSIDGSVLLASLFENVGLRPYIVILAEHAIVGVSRPDQVNDRIYIETTLLGRSTIESILSFESTFTAATKAGKEAYNEGYSRSVNQESGIFTVVDIKKARREGVLPIY
jgi:hypothetical protein